MSPRAGPMQVTERDLLSLWQYIQRHPGVPLFALAGRFGRNIERHLADLEARGWLLFENDGLVWDFRKHWSLVESQNLSRTLQRALESSLHGVGV